MMGVASELQAHIKTRNIREYGKIRRPPQRPQGRGPHKKVEACPDPVELLFPSTRFFLLVIYSFILPRALRALVEE
jgi:hypothetical protein